MSKNVNKNSFSSTPILDSIHGDPVKPLKSNLLLQNCFVRDLTVAKLAVVDHVKDYISLDEVTTPNGIELRESVNPYPITPQYVNSFVDSSDYRRDPFNAVANAPVRNNLGDIAEVQRVASMDTETARKLFFELSERLGKVIKTPTAEKPVAPDSTSISRGE